MLLSMLTLEIRTVPTKTNLFQIVVSHSEGKMSSFKLASYCSFMSALHLVLFFWRTRTHGKITRLSQLTYISKNPFFKFTELQILHKPWFASLGALVHNMKSLKFGHAHYNNEPYCKCLSGRVDSNSPKWAKIVGFTIYKVHLDLISLNAMNKSHMTYSVNCYPLLKKSDHFEIHAVVPIWISVGN